VWLVTALFGVLLMTYGALTPLYRAPDEARHVDTVLSLRDGRGYPAAGEAVLGAAVLGSYEVLDFASRPNGQPASPLPLLPRDLNARSAPSFRDVPTPPPGPPQLNQMTQHPPLYYAVGAAVLFVIPFDQDLPFPYVVGLMRLMSSLLILPLPLLAYAATRRLLGDGPAAVAASVVPVGVPQLLFIGGSVSNDNLLTALVGLTTVLLVHVALGDGSRRTAVLTGTLVAAALLTKGFALALLPPALLAYALCRAARGQALRPGALAGGISLIGVAWYVINLLRYGTLQPEVTIQASFSAAGPGFDVSVRQFLQEFVVGVNGRFWGSFGYAEVPLSVPVTTAATAVLLAVVVIGVVHLTPRLASIALLLLLPLLGISAMLLLGTFGFYARYGVLAGLQGRYLLSALVGVAVLAGAGLWVVVGRWAALTALLAALALQTHALGALLTGFWRGTPLQGLTVGAQSSWAPEAVVLLLFGIAAALSVIAVLALLPRARLRASGE
jgi:small subunit ribosomal protein S36